MIRKYIIAADDSVKGFDEEIAKLEREWGAEEIEPCEDCISRTEAINAFEKFIHELGIKDEPYNYGEMALSVQNVPSVKPQRPKGRWIQTKDDCDGVNFYDFSFECSKCGKEQSFKSDYCPNCGADMRGGMNDD